MGSQSVSSSGEIPLLTFNSLYNLLREEKKSKSLQHLPELFYEALDKFMFDKKSELVKLKSNSESPEKIRRERNVLNNSKKIAMELLNLRLVKISNIAIKNEIFGDDVLSKDCILESEMVYFDSIVKATSKIKKGVDLK